MAQFDIGMIGLGVMGQNLSLNMADHGFSVAGYDAWPEPVDKFVSKAKTDAKDASMIGGYKTPAEFVAALRKPRRIIMLVKAGEIVDKTIATLLPLLEKGDILVDAGNEHYPNTERRSKELDSKGIRYFGMGVSGGELGARFGPSMMPGGDRAAYEELAPVFTKIAAQVKDGPCVTYIGPGGAGHYVKMVHNGIEYGDMQLIAEAYDVLKTVGGLSNAELADVFDAWNKTELESYLIEITAMVFRKKDPEGPGELVDQILDVAGMKGTGKWTVEDAAEIGAAIPTIASSVEARILSSQKAERVAASKILKGPSAQPVSHDDRRQLVEDVRHALYAAKSCSYAQGMNLLRLASELRNWNLQLGEIARIWQGGCIIRAQFLSRIKDAYQRDAKLANLLIDKDFASELAARQDGWRRVVGRAITNGIPMATTAGSLAYYDAYRRERLPVNLTQAQRDLFGSHTYQRIDREGTFHTEWVK